MPINQKVKEQRLVEFDRDMLRSSFVSIFWSVISERRKKGKFTLQSLADRLRIDKSCVSRWFSDDPPNWQSDTIADVARVLNVELIITARDRSTGQVFTSAGAESMPRPKLSDPITDI